MEEPGVVSSKVFKESSGNNILSKTLSSGLGDYSLNKFYKEVLYFWFSHFSSDFKEDVSHLHVPVHITDRVMDSKEGNFFLRFNKSVEITLSLWQAIIEEIASIEWIDNGFCFFGLDDLSVENVCEGIRILWGNFIGIKFCPLRKSGEATCVLE